MQNGNVACRDLDKVSFERAVGCFGTSQLDEHATRANKQLLDMC